MKSLFYTFLAMLGAVLTSGCENLAIKGNGNNVVYNNYSSAGQQGGRPVRYSQPGRTGCATSNQCGVGGGEQIVVVRDHSCGRIVWRGYPSQMPEQYVVGYRQHIGVSNQYNSFDQFGGDGGYRQTGYSNRNQGMFTGSIGGHVERNKYYPDGGWVAN